MTADRVQVSLFGDDDEAAKNHFALLKLFSFWPRLTHEAISLLVERFRPLSTVFDASADELRRFFAGHHHVDGYLSAVGLTTPARLDKSKAFAERQRSYLDRSNRGVVLMPGELMYPSQLKACTIPVHWLFCHPSLPVLPSPLVAVIGSRKSNDAQMEVAAEVARLVVAEGGAVITGLATGADSAAHRAAYEASQGTAEAGARHSLVAVLGTGARHVYPHQNTQLAKDLVANGGVVLSELPPAIKGNAKSFILRNRIVAALADYVVAVSGNYASGTAHTLRFAADVSTPVVSLDPEKDSGITRLTQELDGRATTVHGFHDLLCSPSHP